MRGSNNIKVQIIITVTACLAFVGLIAVFVFIPSIEYIYKTSEKISAQKEYLLEQYNMNKNIKSTSENLKIIKYNMLNLDNIFIHKNKELDFITALENIASKKNIEQNIAITPTKEKNNDYKKTQIQINISGNFQNILEYLNEIEKLNYYINIYSIDISKNNESSIKGIETIEDMSKKVTCVISAYTYWK